MTYARFSPSPRLAPLVADIWIQESLSDARALGFPPTRVLPTGFVDIAFYYRDPFVEVDDSGTRPLALANVTGPQTTYRTYAATGRTGIVLARLWPGAASAFFRVPLHELRDRNIDLSDLLPASAVADVRERLSVAGGGAARAATVGAFLESHLVLDSVSGSVRAAIERIIGSGGARAVGDIAETLGLGLRRLQRSFRDGVGIGPKAFSRIVRFQRALDLQAGGLSWALTAHTAGYQDQSHLANDCRMLTGLTPQAVQRRREASRLSSYFNSGPAASPFCKTLYL